MTGAGRLQTHVGYNVATTRFRIKSMKHASNLFRSEGSSLLSGNCGRLVQVIVLSLMGFLSLCACTSRGIYESARQDARTACLYKPSGIERDKCLDKNSQSYDDFTREREKVQQEEE